MEREMSYYIKPSVGYFSSCAVKGGTLKDHTCSNEREPTD